MRYTLYLFDMDLTLLDARECAKISYREAHKVVGDDFDEKNLLSFLAVPLTDSYFTIKDPKGSFEDYCKVFEQYTRSSVIDHSYLYEDGIELLKKLHSLGKKIGIVTNRSRYCVNGVLSKYPEIQKMIDTIITCDVCEKLKPDAEPILNAMKEVGCSASETVYVGDALNDFNSAKNAQVDFVCVNRYNTCKFDSPIVVKDLKNFDF